MLAVKANEKATAPHDNHGYRGFFHSGWLWAPVQAFRQARAGRRPRAPRPPSAAVATAFGAGKVSTFVRFG